MTCEPLPCQQRWKLTIDSGDWQFLAGLGTWQSDIGVHLQINLASPSSPCSLPSGKDGIGNQIQLCRVTPSRALQVTFSCHPAVLCPQHSPLMQHTSLPCVANLFLQTSALFGLSDLRRHSIIPFYVAERTHLVLVPGFFFWTTKPAPNSHGGKLSYECVALS